MKAAKKVELLAPAGNAEAFYGAIHAGADAIYLGGSRFGARAYAENFSEEELVACIRYAHLFQRKVYLTVNTLVKESEFSGLYEYVLPYYRAGLDGVIVQDTGVFAYLREHFPGMELHGSTQMTITGEYGAAFLKEQGACRVVPARELSLAEIRRIDPSPADHSPSPEKRHSPLPSPDVSPVQSNRQYHISDNVQSPSRDSAEFSGSHLE